MTDSSTLTSRSLRWPPGEQGESGPGLFQLIIAWSRDEPRRIGETAVIDGKAVLGRGDSQPPKPAQRLTFRRERPTGSTATPPLAGQSLSRIQLEFSPEQDGLRVSCIGRCPLFVNGEPTSQGVTVVKEGDTLTLRNTMVLLVVRRQRSLSVPQLPKDTTFSFGESDPYGIVGESPAAWRLRSDLAFAGRAKGHVLVTGESGVGKELAATAIHAMSPGGNFVARNAATLPEGLVDAELFGSAKNYPHAGSPERPGLIGDADGGTLFLDEIGELPAPLQAHLLRVLDRGGEYQRLGESKVRHSNLRLIAATNRPLDALKHDFAARFLTRVHVPGLHERREDIPLLLRRILLAALADDTGLAERYLGRSKNTLSEPRIAPEIVDALLHHSYRHHFRELERLVWIALSTSSGDYLALTPELATELQPSDPGSPLRSTQANDGEPSRGALPGRAEIQAALDQAGGSVTHAARLLGLSSRYVLYRLMKQYGLTKSDEPSEG